jgi:hypothetical protein
MSGPLKINDVGIDTVLICRKAGFWTSLLYRRQDLLLRALDQILNMSHPLVRLADGNILDGRFRRHAKQGRAAFAFQRDLSLVLSF